MAGLAKPGDCGRGLRGWQRRVRGLIGLGGTRGFRVVSLPSALACERGPASRLEEWALVNRRAIITVATRNYAHFAQVVLASCRAAHPEADLFVCYADRPPHDWTETVPGVQVIHGDQLGIPDWRRVAFQYTPFELSCAIKPHAMRRLLELGYQEIVYLDADTVVYGPLAEVFESLAHSSIVLTPHLLNVLPDDGRRPHERAFLVSGTFNAGFLALRSDDVARRFLAWWQSMVSRSCFVDLAGSLFVDQKWLDLVPGLFEGVHVLRHPGYNAGHWSLSQFPFEPLEDSGQTSSGVAVDGRPLVLFHFSGMTPAAPNEYLSSQNRTSLAEIPPLLRLTTRYHADLAASGMSRCESWGCEFDRLSDGTTIHPAWREAVRRRHAGFTGIADPFDVASQPHLLSRYRSIRGVAVKWRRDWQLRWPRERGIAGQVRKANKSFKSMLRLFRGRSKSA